MKRLAAVVLFVAVPVAAEHFLPLNLEAIDRDRDAGLFEPGAGLAHLTPNVISMLTAEVRKLRKVAALPVVAQETPPQPQAPGYVEGSVPSDCGEAVCVVPKADFERLVETNMKMYRELAAKAKAPPKCATLEVTEPPKREIPPLKKEREL